jgi:RNA polymerase sigma-70 factor (ECF subfamily)
LSETDPQSVRDALRHGDHRLFGQLVEPYRAELQLHCYRMMGSAQDAEDMVQETLLRAWRYLESFQGRGSLRAWLYRIATNACLDTLGRHAHRTLPGVTYPPAAPHDPILPPPKDADWIGPFPDAILPDEVPGPEAQYNTRESVRLAFMVALHALPSRQRAVLLLRDVLGWRARETAQQLEMTIAAVNSALHRARTTLRERYHPIDWGELVEPPADAATEARLERYVRAWETADVEGLVALLAEEATFSMPPSPSWYQGRIAIHQLLAHAIMIHGAGQWRLIPTAANAQPAFGLYERGAGGTGYHPFALQVLTFDGPALSEITNFVEPALLPVFGLPAELQA